MLLTIILFILLTPSIDDDTPDQREISYSYRSNHTQGIDRALDSFFTELKGDGYKVENKFPTYIALEKHHFLGNPTNYAQKMSKDLYKLTGTHVKVILETQSGRYIGLY